ncbi:MAG: ABC transporter substrate-binding protein [Oscillospiraceae bacterium]|nr:ABC transporter substrate-binding protein [Oscillospiraceae bacterium]
MKRTSTVIILSVLCLLLSACGAEGGSGNVPVWNSLTPLSEEELSYATEFSLTHYSEGLTLLSVSDGERYLIVPESADVPAGLDGDITVLRQPLRNLYLVATSAMDLFRALDAVDCIRLSGLKQNDWYIAEAAGAMERGELLYAGKYSAPDYERICQEKCSLAVESTMIYHTPEVKEQLERLGIPVFVERSSYERHPLGRMEWIKVYGALLGREEAAGRLFEAELEKLDDILSQSSTGKTVAFFSINSNGSVTVRKSGDYIARSIELAGGRYIFPDLGADDSAVTTLNMQMETFYDEALSADILIYNSTINGQLSSLQELLAESPMLADFKAVKEGKVWCTSRNLFQETMSLGGLITDIHTILSENDSQPLRYLFPLA